MKIALCLFLGLLSITSFAEPSSHSVPNFHQVDSDIYRGGRPDGTLGLQDLQAMGIKTIIDLEDDSQAMSAEKSEALKLGMRWISKPMNADTTPSDSEVDSLLQTLENQTGTPIFIHCLHGQDRTGMIIGIFRVEAQKWTPSAAYKEMLTDGFHPKYQALDQYFKKRERYSATCPMLRPGTCPRAQFLQKD